MEQKTLDKKKLLEAKRKKLKELEEDTALRKELREVNHKLQKAKIDNFLTKIGLKKRGEE